MRQTDVYQRLMVCVAGITMSIAVVLSASGVSAARLVVEEQAPAREASVIHLPRQWAFRLDPSGVGQEQRWYDPAVAEEDTWDRMQVTASWNEQLISDDPEDPAMIQYYGVAWYWTPFEAPRLDATQELWLEIGALEQSAWVYVNGKKIAAREAENAEAPAGGNTSYRFNLTEHVVADVNHLIVRVEARSRDGGITRPAILRRVGRNLVVNGGFESEQQAWDVKRPAEPERAVDWKRAAGKYAAERAVQISAGGVGPVMFSQAVDQPLQAGAAYEVSVRYRLPSDADTDADAPPVRVKLWGEGDEVREGGDTAIELHDVGEASAEWKEAAAIVRPERDHARFHIRLEFSHPGVYVVDEVAVRPVALPVDEDGGL